MTRSATVQNMIDMIELCKTQKEAEWSTMTAQELTRQAKCMGLGAISGTKEAIVEQMSFYLYGERLASLTMSLIAIKQKELAKQRK